VIVDLPQAIMYRASSLTRVMCRRQHSSNAADAKSEVQKRLASLPASLHRPDYADSGLVKEELPQQPALLDEDACQRLRSTCRTAKKALDSAREMASTPGISSADLEEAIHKDLVRRGAYPSQLNFHGFPRSVSM